jgi:hypothetical protein
MLARARTVGRGTLPHRHMIEFGGGSAFTSARQQKKLTLIRRVNPGMITSSTSTASWRRRR